MVDIKYIGHSAFELNIGEKSILIDPYVSINPRYNWREVNIANIFVTHGHFDHIGEAVEISKEKDVPVTAIAEVAGYCAKHGAKSQSVNLGGWLNYEWGRAIFLPAFHSSALPDGKYGGVAASILFDIDGIRIYHAGDTSLSSEMKIIRELYAPTIAMLPIGGNYTMDAEHAVIAAKWLGVKTVIPMHYNTFPEIQADVDKFTQLLDGANPSCCILNPEEI